MLDKNLLHALMDRKRFDLLYTSVPVDMFDGKTVGMLKWFGFYFNQHPEHDKIDLDALNTMFKLQGKMEKEQLTLMTALTDTLRKPVDESVLKATCNQLETLRYEGEIGMLLKRHQDGAEIDLANEIAVATQLHKQRADAQEKALWCDTDVWELIQNAADDSGYKLLFLPSEIHENLKGLTTGKNVCIAMPTDKGKTSLFCAAAVSLAKQHKQFLETGYEPKFRPVLYLINEGMAEDITPRLYQTALGLTNQELYDLGKKIGGAGIRKKFEEVVGRYDAIRLVNIHGMTTAQVSRIIEAHDPFCTITDMTGRIRAMGAQGANDIAQLEYVWDTMRQFTAIHRMFHIGSAQISAEGFDQLYPPLSALQNSKTGIQTTLDLALWGGAYAQPLPEVEFLRGLSTPKNKLKKTGCKAMLKTEVIFNPDRNTWC